MSAEFEVVWFQMKIASVNPHLNAFSLPSTRQPEDTVPLLHPATFVDSLESSGWSRLSLGASSAFTSMDAQAFLGVAVPNPHHPPVCPLRPVPLHYFSHTSEGFPPMLVVMQSHATEEQVRAVCERIESLGLKAHPIPGSGRTAIGITGNNGAVDLGVLESMPGVVECIPVTKPYKLVSRDVKEEDTVVT